MAAGGDKVKKLSLTAALLLILGLMLYTAACQPEEEEEFDQEALVAVDKYINEMTEALSDETLRADLKGWVRDYYEDDLPLYYDEERREWLKEHKEALQGARQKHLDSSFPKIEDIFEWEVIVVRGDTEWMLKGEELVQALRQLDMLYEDVTGTIDMIIDSDGELDLEQSEQVLNLLEEIDPAVEEIRSVLLR